MSGKPISRVSVDELKWHEGHGLYTYEGAPFTGAAFEMGRTGTLEWETEYRDGLRDGLQRGWHPDGSLAAEGTFLAGTIHGTYREWHPGGQLAVEMVGEHGILLRERQWDESGRLTKEYAIAEGGPDWQTLQRYRDRFGGR